MSKFGPLCGRRPIAVVMVVSALIVVAGCSGSDSPVTDPAVGERSPSSDTVVADHLLPVAEFKAFLIDYLDAPLINVHIPYEGEIPGTDSFIPFDEIVDAPELPADKDALIAIYCRSGSMSGQAAADLAAAGYTNVVDLKGGMNAWVDAGETLIDRTADDD